MATMTAKDDLSRSDLRWLWLAITLVGAGVATYWFSTGGDLYRTEAEVGGVMGAAETTAKFAVLLAVGAAAVDLIGMLAAARTHTVPAVTSLVCGVAAVVGLIASGVCAQAASGELGVAPDPLMMPAIASMIALAIGGYALWFDARSEHRRAERALEVIERDIHAADHDIM